MRRLRGACFLLPKLALDGGSRRKERPRPNSFAEPGEGAGRLFRRDVRLAGQTPDEGTQLKGVHRFHPMQPGDRQGGA